MSDYEKAREFWLWKSSKAMFAYKEPWQTKSFKPDLIHVIEAKALEQERKRAEVLAKALKHCQVSAGHPDAAQGCRNVIAICEEALREYEEGPKIRYEQRDISKKRRNVDLGEGE